MNPLLKTLYLVVNVRNCRLNSTKMSNIGLNIMTEQAQVWPSLLRSAANVDWELIEKMACFLRGHQRNMQEWGGTSKSP